MHKCEKTDFLERGTSMPFSRRTSDSRSSAHFSRASSSESSFSSETSSHATPPVVADEAIFASEIHRSMSRRALVISARYWTCKVASRVVAFSSVLYCLSSGARGRKGREGAELGALGLSVGRK